MKLAAPVYVGEDGRRPEDFLNSLSDTLRDARYAFSVRDLGMPADLERIPDLVREQTRRRRSS